MLTGSLTGLRALEPEDLEQLREWRNRPENRKHFREYREIGPSSQKEWYEQTRCDHHYEMFGIVRLDNEWLIGATGLCFIDWLSRSAEVSLYIGEGYVDSTYAPDALCTVMRYGFEDLGLHRLHAETYEFDTHKQNLLLNAEFRQEGELRDAHFTEGKWYDVYVYGLLSHEFNEERGHGLSW